MHVLSHKNKIQQCYGKHVQKITGEGWAVGALVKVGKPYVMGLEVPGVQALVWFLDVGGRP